MPISRRGFIGKIIGSLVVSQVPFLAEAYTGKKEIFCDIENQDFEMVIWTREGGEIYAPRIKEIKDDGKILTLAAEGIEATETFRPYGMTLINRTRNLMFPRPFQYEHTLIQGDKLFVHFSIDGLDEQARMDFLKGKYNGPPDLWKTSDQFTIDYNPGSWTPAAGS